jgi:hypothetical protein
MPGQLCGASLRHGELRSVLFHNVRDDVGQPSKSRTRASRDLACLALLPRVRRFVSECPDRSTRTFLAAGRCNVTFSSPLGGFDFIDFLGF